ncbi:hypothetical protein LIER_37282 [Lithospermum erythrorhizon]|uniref:Uncharacterized protein n=1 Tax=Lithospermum erythrorhizon TaxID=34254 RepID=A0AAV3PM56_LITER
MNEVLLVSPNVVCSSDEEDEDLEGDLGGGVVVSPLPRAAELPLVSDEPPSLIPPGVMGVSDGSAGEELTKSGDGNGGDVGVDVEDLGRGGWKSEVKRVKYSTVKLKDYVTKTAQKLSSPLSPSTAQALGTSCPLTNSLNCNRFSIGHRSFLAALTASTEPRSFKEAMKYPQWREAMKKEIEALEDNGTWSVVQLPKGKKALWNSMGLQVAVHTFLVVATVKN